MRRFAVKTLIVLTSYALLLVNIFAGETNLTDVRKCRVTHAGTEYRGPISKTASGIRCQFWDKEYTTSEVSQSIEDNLFPDGSKILAQNWCRNPGGQLSEPWCYTKKNELVDEFCNVPLCIYHECRLTGPGVEYAGQVERSSSERECRPWTDRHKDVGANKTDRFPNSAFPERSRRNAKRRCRNPDGDPGGPWCYVEIPENDYREEEKNGDEKHDKGAKKLDSFDGAMQEEADEERVEKEYCDVPFCGERDCMVYTTGGAGRVVHSHWTSLGNTQRDYHNISLAVKLWRPEDWHRVRLYLALSVLAVPSSGSQIQEWQAGVELTLSNTKSGIVTGGKVCHLPPALSCITSEDVVLKNRQIYRFMTTLPLSL